MNWILLIVIVVSSIVICYQDFKDRAIHLFLILLFGVSSVFSYLRNYSWDSFLENTLFCLGYLVFCYLVLHLYLFIKNRKFEKLLDRKIGWGDVLVFVGVGITLTPLHMLYFFSLSFILALVFALVFISKAKTIPLAGMVSVLYAIYLVYEKVSGYLAN